MTASPVTLTTAWAILAQALAERHPVHARYHGQRRLLCPHILGWKHGRPKVLAYQAEGTTSSGPLPLRPEQRWRSLFIDEIYDITIAWTQPWQTANNYSADSNCVDQIALAIPGP
jgi:hypothetical protein